MSTYSLRVEIDPKWVTEYNARGQTMALCLAFGVAETPGVQPNFNVVAALVPGGHNKLSDSVTFSWDEAYQMAATQQAQENGVLIAAATTPQDIQYGEHYALDSDWSGGVVSSDPNAPTNGFLFIIPPGDQATCVVYKKMTAPGGSPEMAPFYTSAGGPLTAGTETLIPIITAKVWWQAITESAVMWDGFVGDTWTVTYPVTPPTTSLTVYFDSNGDWGNGPLPAGKA